METGLTFALERAVSRLGALFGDKDLMLDGRGGQGLVVMLRQGGHQHWLIASHKKTPASRRFLFALNVYLRARAGFITQRL